MAYDLSGIRILVVDPSPFRRTLIADVLKALGVMQVEAVSDGAVAYGVFRSATVDVVIAEQMMAPLDGLDLTRMIRTAPDSPNTTVPILMITSAPRTEDVAAARDAGVTEFMVMPFSVTGLYNRLASIIENPRDFVQDGDYFGPDRRRSVKEFLGGDQRTSDE